MPQRKTRQDEAERRSGRGGAGPAWLPPVVALVGVLGAVAASGALAKQERAHLQHAADTALHEVESEIGARMDSHILALELLARRLERTPAPVRTEWEADVLPLARQESIQAIEWVDPDFRVRWVVPLAGNEEAQGLDLSFERHRRDALIEARDARAIRFSHWIDLVQGGKGFLAYAPVYRGPEPDDFGGFVLGVYRIEPLLDLVLANVSPAHGVSVEAGGETAWSRHAANQDDPLGSATGTLSLPGIEWYVSVWSPDAVRRLYLSHAPPIVLVVGIALSLVLAFALRQMFLAQQHSGELARAQDELERRVEERTSELVRANERLRAEIVERERAEARVRANEEELAQVLRRVMMGEMATGLAHELTQPLASIANYAEACSIQLQRDELDRTRLEQALAEVLAHTRHAGEVIHRLRELLRKRETRRAELPAAEIVDQAVRLVAPVMASKGIDLAVDVGSELCVDADPIQIEQVLLNLLRNSIDAMTHAGTPDPRVHLAAARTSGRRIELTISDNGPGLSEESLSRLFEPFFTTKERGLGMGLAISRTIVEAHGGELHHVRNGGTGAAFRFDLPGPTLATSDG